MFYYEIWVGSAKFQGQKPLTYASDEELQDGHIVQVPLRTSTAMGFVVNQTTVDAKLQPKIKSIIDSTPYILPAKNRALHSWLMGYYPGPSGITTNMFLPTQAPKKSIKEESLAQQPSIQLPPLTTDQKRALSEIERAGNKSILLHGDTGTGKTRVYEELTRKTIHQGKSAVILTPEIGLTPQLLKDFEQLFRGAVVVLHSNLTLAQRRDAYYRIISSVVPLVVIGPRSALFAPLKTVGLIIVDEAHEHTYKQEQSPNYQATRVASQLARLHGAPCIFGTATPSIQDYYVFKEKAMPMVRMSKLATGKRVEPHVQIVDMTDRSQLTNSSIVSKPLFKAINDHTTNHQQVLLFLNRRGNARIVLCQQCGWQALCPRCDILLTLHSDENQLRCHTCGFTQHIITSCPECHSQEVIYNSPGTKALEMEMKRLFPSLSIKRFDSDNLTHEKLENNYSSLLEGSVDIIIGTQLITKGLDLPKLGLVGIINADASLNFPDFSSEEKTYQQLIQVIGRAGRHQSQNTVVIQTYNANSNLLKSVLQKDWKKFFSQQIIERARFGFPPFAHFLQLSTAKSTQKSAQSAAEKLATELRKEIPGIIIKGPSPRLQEKMRGQYHWQLLISSKQRSRLLEVIAHLPSGWRHNLDPNNTM